MKTSDEHFIVLKIWKLLIFETQTGIIESQEAIDDFINQQKSSNTNKKMATDLNTLLRYMEASSIKNEKIESSPASELDHLLSNKQCHIINNLLTSLARAVLGNIGPSARLVSG